MSETDRKTAKPEVIQMLAKRTKCWQCKHKFTEPVLLPVDTPQPGVLRPNINTDVLVHLKETHGIAPETLREWIIGAVYGYDLGLFGIKGVVHDGTDWPPACYTNA